MHRLTRQVRFSITPFLPSQPDGFNTYASKPTGDGLSFYLALWVELEGELDSETGFVVNVSQIDDILRRYAIPRFTERINASLDARECLFVDDLASILAACTPELCRLFEQEHHKTLNALRLDLNPFRSVEIDCQPPVQSQGKDLQMVIYTEKFEFSAMHKLWNDKFSDSKNLEVFGKCANPAGHGHNYILEVAVEIPMQAGQDLLQGWIADFQKSVKTGFLEMVDHKNLNADVDLFKNLNPTVENIASFAWRSLTGQFGPAKLSRITVWENDRTCCTYTEDYTL